MSGSTNWTAVGAVAGILGLAATAGVTYLEFGSQTKDSKEISISTQGKDSPVIIGNEGTVNVD